MGRKENEGIAMAFCRSDGGEEAEKAARQSFWEEKDASERENLKALQDARKESFKKVCRLSSTVIRNSY